MGDGQIAMLPRGVDEYLEMRARRAEPAPVVPAAAAKPASGSAEERAARKTIARVDKQLERIAAREAALHAKMAENLSDHERLAALSAELSDLAGEKDTLESEWLEAAATLE